MENLVGTGNFQMADCVPVSAPQAIRVHERNNSLITFEFDFCTSGSQGF